MMLQVTMVTYFSFCPNAQFTNIEYDKKVTNWVLTKTLSEKIKSFDTSLEPPMSNLANGRATLKFKNSALVQKCSSPLYSNFN